MAQPQQTQQYASSPQFPHHTTLQPAASPASFQYPQHKRQRLASDGQGQLSPQPAYSQSPYGNMSPNAAASPAGTPNGFSNVGIPAGAYATSPSGAAYNTPYTNSSPGPNMPPSNMQNQSGYQQMSADYQQSNMSHNQNQAFNNYGVHTTGAGTMGPPSKPVDKEEGVDPMDVLGGTGIDLKAEEQYLINNSFNTQVSDSQSGTMTPGHNYGVPGDEKSFYGAGPANSAPETMEFKSQDDYHQYAANQAWQKSARDLSDSRQEELNDPFLVIGYMHAKMQKIARENGLALHIDKNNSMGTMKLPSQFDNRGVRVQSMGNSQSLITVTKGGFVPPSSLLVDQLALLSIASKQRLRTLLEDSNRLAKGRQTGSHGIIPEEWADVAAPVVNTDSTPVAEGALRGGWESAVSPHSNPLKRSFSQANKILTPVSDGGKAPITSSKITNEVAAALRSSAVKERDFEEARLKKRAARNNGELGATPRQGSIIPGTPGSVAPEDKAPTKKEQKKKAEAKVNEAANHAAANVTIAQFMGGKNIFGKKKGGYSWATTGATGGGGFSTPGRINTQGGLPNTPSAGPAPLTQEGARRMGAWREDKEKGRNIQIRDWITVLESDGHDKRSLQKAYMYLDNSDPK